ncbi:hypothetical protein ACFWIB_33680 [Streptomyces sp. NPDC127051]|uniref:hypothetical protein n=1 Tax=Streptomyces sp. NPDC127051 TaxID=3347119 RepID=UPI003667AEFF
MHDLAEAVGQDGWKDWAGPVSVDLVHLRLGAAPLGVNVAAAGFLPVMGLHAISRGRGGELVVCAGVRRSDGISHQ